MSTHLHIDNVKITVQTDIPFRPTNTNVTICGKIFAVKIYPTNPFFINFTGLKSLADIDLIKTHLQTCLSPVPGLKRVNVDSMFASRRLPRPILYDMGKIWAYCRAHCQRDYFVYYNPELTTSKCLLLPRGKKTKRKLKQGRCTRAPQISLFHTGSVTVMGIRSLDQIEKADKLIHRIYHDMFKRPNQKSNDSQSADVLKVAH